MPPLLANSTAGTSVENESSLTLFCFSWVIHFYQWFSPHSKFDSARVEIEDLPRCAAEDESELLFRKFQT